MEMKKIKINWKGQEAEVEIKKMNWGEKNDIQQSAIITKMVGNSFQTELNQKILKEQALLKCIVKAPFNVDLSTIRELPAELGDKLVEEISSFNAFIEYKKKEN